MSVASPSSDWDAGLCDCYREPGTCCLVFWCPCIAYGQIVGALPNGSMWCAGDSSSAAAGYCGLEVLGFLFNNLKKQAGLGGRIVGSFGEAGVDVAEGSLVAVSRNRLRKKYSIREPDDCIHSDCFVAFCCSRCAMCQEEHEIHAREGTRRKPKTVLIAPASIQM